MNLSRFAFAATALATFASCGPTQSSPVAIHEVQLYGQSAQRLLWAYGALPNNEVQRTIEVEEKAVTLTQNGEDRRLNMNGQAFLGLPMDKRWTQKVSTPQIVLNVDGTFNVRSAPGVSALYYTDGYQWFKLSAAQGTHVQAQRITNFRTGWGSLTSAELQQLTGALASGQPLIVGVLSPRVSLAPRARIQPAAADSRLTGLVVSRPAYEVPAGGPRPSAPIATPDTLRGGHVDVASLAKGNNAATQSAGVQVATTPEQVRRLYASAYGRQTTRPPLPSTEGRTLVGIFLGQRLTGGHSVEVTSASVDKNVLTLNVREHSPRKDMLVTQALTSPWAIVAVEGRFDDVRVQGLPSVGPGQGAVQ